MKVSVWNAASHEQNKDGGWVVVVHPAQLITQRALGFPWTCNNQTQSKQKLILNFVYFLIKPCC